MMLTDTTAQTLKNIGVPDSRIAGVMNFIQNSSETDVQVMWNILFNRLDGIQNILANNLSGAISSQKTIDALSALIQSPKTIQSFAKLLQDDATVESFAKVLQNKKTTQSVSTLVSNSLDSPEVQTALAKLVEKNTRIAIHTSIVSVAPMLLFTAGLFILSKTPQKHWPRVR